MEATGAERIIVLHEDHVYFGGMSLTYRFSVLTGEPLHRYLIGVQLGEECCEVEAGTDLGRAFTYYQRIREGCVTPCTLEDVLQDLRYA